MLTMLSGNALADNPQIYKWTDAQGVVHYSDKPPVVVSPDRYLLKLPPLPPIDPQKIAAIEARIASINAMLQRIHAQDEAEEKQQRELDAQKTAQEAAMQPVIERVVETVPVYPVYAERSRFERRHHQDRDDIGRTHRSQQHSATPIWPFPYNLDNNSSFPEEWHRTSGH